MPVFFCTLQMASGWPAFHNKSRTWRTWLFSGSGYWRAGWRPNATVLSVMGDGSFNFSCGELETIVRYQLPIKMFVFSNKTFGWIKAVRILALINGFTMLISGRQIMPQWRLRLA